MASVSLATPTPEPASDDAEDGQGAAEEKSSDDQQSSDGSGDSSADSDSQDSETQETGEDSLTDVINGKKITQFRRNFSACHGSSRPSADPDPYRYSCKKRKRRR